jgi:hypothetical protein
MTTAYTSLLGLALPVTGELSGTWGDTVNNYITGYLDAAVAGTNTLSTDADVTLVKTTNTSLSGTSSQYAVLLWTAGGTATRTIIAPSASSGSRQFYIVVNKTSSTQSIKLCGTGPTTGVTVTAGTSALCAWNGVDFVQVGAGLVNLTTGVTGTLPVANGGTGVTTSTGSGNNVLSTSPTLTTPTFTSPVINSATISTVGGTAPLSMARSWVLFDGTSGSIFGSFNTSSVTRNATGNYTVNFTTALHTSSYATAASASAAGSLNNGAMCVSVYCSATGTNVTPTTTAFQIITYNPANTVLQDTTFVNCVSFA